MKMKIMFLPAVFFLIAVIGFHKAGLSEEDISVMELVEKANRAAYYAGDDGTAKVKMTIKDKQDRTREREFIILRKNGEEWEQNFYVYFLRPADVRKMSFLVWKHIKTDDDRWLYLPSLDLVKRIAGGDKRTSFAGTDFFYEDISGRSIYDDKHVLEETTEAYYVLKNTPEDADIVEFSYYITKIDKKTYLPMVVEFYDKQGELYRIYEVQEVQIFQDIPTITRAVMKDLKTGSETSAEFSRVKYNIGLEDNIFTERYLRRAPRKWIKAR